jgi:hypothetical protein
MKEDVKVGDTAMLKMYSHVAKLASHNSHLLREVTAANAILTNRKSDVVTMFRHTTRDVRYVRAKKILFAVWVIALLCFLSVSFTFLAMERYGLLLRHSYLIIGAIVTFISVSWVYGKIVHRYPTVML